MAKEIRMLRKDQPHRRCALLTVRGVLDRCKGKTDEFTRRFLGNLEAKLILRPCRHAEWHPRDCPKSKKNK